MPAAANAAPEANTGAESTPSEICIYLPRNLHVKFMLQIGIAKWQPLDQAGADFDPDPDSDFDQVPRNFD